MDTIKIPEELLPSSTFACGPSQGHPDIRNAKFSDVPFERSHRSPDVAKNGLYKEASDNLKKLLGLPEDYLIIFVSGGATHAMDIVAWNFAQKSMSGLLLGAFSQLWGKKIAKNLPADVKKTMITPNENEQFPTERPDLNADFVFLTPNETSMGISIPDNYLAEIYDNKSDNTIVGWDCTSCAGGRKLPADKFDIMIFSMQKCFGVGGGTGVIVMSPRAIEKYNSIDSDRYIPYTLGLTEMINRSAQKDQTLNTPSTINIWMFNEALKWMLSQGGIDATDKLVRSHYQALSDWIEKSDKLSFWVKDPQFRSKTTVTIEFDSSIDVNTINQTLAAQGKSNLRDAIKKYSSMEGNVCRVACFPFVDITGAEQFKKLIQSVDYIIENS